MKTLGLAVRSATSALEGYSFLRRDVGEHDVRINIAYCGICHSDIHQARDEWGGSIYPMVPGHEIVGTVSAVGAAVTHVKVGERVGVGCFVDSCRACDWCKGGEEQFCDEVVNTYNALERDKKTPVFGGYSQHVVVDERYVLHVSEKLSMEAVAPLLCAGITTYSPLRQLKVQSGMSVAVLGLGGLGHMAVKLAAAMGAEVTMLSSSASKEADAVRLGAHDFVLTRDSSNLRKLRKRFDAIINTVSASHDMNAYISLLKVHGTMMLVGVPPEAISMRMMPLVANGRAVRGSLIGGIPETQEMLNFCASKNITADVEVIAARDANGAYERVIKGDVKYRFVIDCKTLG